MKDITKLKIAKGLSACAFWMPVAILFFTTRDLTIEEGLFAIGFYSICIVFLEYPTGVIGDYFSHKLSVSLGYLIIGISVLFIYFPIWNGNVYMLMFLLFFSALGNSLFSGSDDALLYSISKNFKNDLAGVHSFSTTILSLAAILGGFIAKFNLSITMLLTGICFIFASIMTVTIKVPEREEKGMDEEKGNIFSKSLEGIRYVKTIQYLLNYIILTSLILALAQGIKWILNPLYLEINIDQVFWGILLSIFTLITAFGTKIYPTLNKQFNIIVAFLIYLSGLFLVGLAVVWIIPLFGLVLVYFFNGYLKTHLLVKINGMIRSSVRASVLSLNNLFSRLISSLYISLAGWVITEKSIFVLMTVTVLLVAIISLFVMRHKIKKSYCKRLV